MHKLKNKHTGKVITTPYMAEVEEYLNSGDYEMSDNKYPAILKLENGCIVLADSDGCGTSLSYYKDDYEETFENKHYADFNFGCSKNITREYLTKTYGKCESQEHADFICKLAENEGFKVFGFHSTDNWFYFDSNSLHFVILEFDANDDDQKLINLPLPPKDKEMPETKPVYTKEMHERGELPPVGSCFVMNDTPSCFSHSKFNGLPCEVLALTEYEDGVVVTFNNEKEGFGALWHNEGMEPIPTIEDEFVDYVRESVKNLNIECLSLAILNKYNITPK